MSLSTEHKHRLLVGAFLLFLSIGLPFYYLELKLFLIVCIVLATLAKGVSLDRSVLILAFCYAMWGALYTIYGIALDTPGALRDVGVNVLWPLLYCTLVASVRRLRTIACLTVTLLAGAAFIGAYSISFFLAWKFGLPSPDFFGIVEVFPSDGTSALKVFVPYGTSLLFLIPFLISWVLYPPQFPAVPRYIPYLLLAGGFVSAYMLHRNAIYIAIALAPLIAVVTKVIVRNEPLVAPRLSKRVLGVAICAVALSIGFTAINPSVFETIVRNIELGFEFDSIDAIGAHARYTQFTVLIDAWLERPVFGHGLGAVVPGYSRNDARPWIFELTYLALLFQTGMVGVAAYAAIVFAFLGAGVRAARLAPELSNLCVAVLCGTMSLLIGNATNPYLLAFDHLWALFAPLALLNVASLNTAQHQTYAGFHTSGDLQRRQASTGSARQHSGAKLR